MAVVDIATLLMVAFAMCVLPEMISQALADVGEAFYFSAWYDRALHRNGVYVIVPMQCAQREFRVVSMGLVGCSLPTFAKVCIIVAME